jgi:hypothetical protein
MEEFHSVAGIRDADRKHSGNLATEFTNSRKRGTHTDRLEVPSIGVNKHLLFLTPG